ncbi:RES family NAD+ phosphorylase [Mucilaginibacter segetis]|uniref:RES family NAD+ phosphorylase n=1 Tax=Mucilaginibacter segetis TaxID=2793071 RepID=A0A934PR88_9SPHI|nr:RES family NAD+ phosphorylase [Mucilaginibacter segetis]MBK0379294.1 RES family NAD+ phosphorylase [Mucilaginibacter segetis]
MKLYRIAREKYCRDLSGYGGQLSAARWHDHLPVIYTSLQSSTCILEKLVHLRPEEIHHDLIITVLDAPDDLDMAQLVLRDLPLNWRSYPAPPVLQRIGNAWLRGKSSALLFVPSVIDPLAQNVLINPLHPDSARITIADVQPFRYDERLR